MKNSIHLTLNGAAIRSSCRPDTTVLEWLRGEVSLRGTKEGCAEGDCGACSVLVKRADEETYVPVNSCIMLMGQLEGASLLTVEGLAASGEGGHRIQQIMAENGSSQCGFCTPGIVCSLAGLLERDGIAEESEIHDALAGNLCRCTGYRPIVEAAQAAAVESCVPLPKTKTLTVTPVVGDEQCRFYNPATLSELLTLRRDNTEAVLLAGGTDISLDVAHARTRWPEAILTRNVSELRRIDHTNDRVSFGGAVTWEECLPVLQEFWPSFATLVRRFGSTQIRAMGTMAGNLANASPIGDGAPCLIALGAEITLANTGGERTLPLDTFFLGYRKSELAADEIIKSVSVAKPHLNQQFRTYKISKRYDQDISTVCGAFNLETNGPEITTARIAYGGMAATPMRCRAAEEALTGRRLDDSSALETAKSAIEGTFTPLSDMRGTADYRARVAVNLLDRLILDIAGETVEVMAL
jgi:xanthine dehydrogenase small subunit